MLKGIKISFKEIKKDLKKFYIHIKLNVVNILILPQTAY